MFIHTPDDLERRLGQRVRRFLRKKSRDPVDAPSRTIVNAARWTHPT